MWHWLKHWRDWAMHNWPFQRGNGPQAQGLHVVYEKAGLTVRNQPIPWNADASYVEALLRIPGVPGHVHAPKKTEFQLRLPGQVLREAVTFHRHEDSDLFRLQFRLPPLRQPVTVELIWRSYVLCQAVVPLLTAEVFVDHLQVQSPTVLVRLDNYTVPCQAYVGTQGRGLLASALLTSPTSLVPLLDLDLAVEFRDLATNHCQVVPVRLIGPQLAANQALVTVVAPKRPHRQGTWAVSWTLAGRVLARSEVRILSQRHLKRSLQLTDSRYVHQNAQGLPVLTRHLPELGAGGRVGPCFLVGSREPGLAALCPLEVRIQHKGGGKMTVLPEQQVLITDGPSLFLPGTVRVEDLPEIVAFELFSREQSLGLLSTCPAPSANFTSEGGFKPHDEYTWNTAAEEELSDRLGKLLELPLD
jgi:hypothetical protein